MSPVSRRAIVYQRHVHLAILRVPGPQWATGATIWTTCLSSYFWAFSCPSEPQEPLYGPHAKLHSYGHSGSPVSSGSHYISPSCTSSHSQAVGVPNERQEPLAEPYVNLAFSRHSASPVNPGATVYQCHVHLAILRALGPQWATGATIWITHKWHLGWAIVDLLGPQWTLRATLWTTCRSRFSQTFWVLSEQYMNQMFI